MKSQRKHIIIKKSPDFYKHIVTQFVNVKAQKNRKKRNLLLLQRPATHLRKQVDVVFTERPWRVKRGASDLELPQRAQINGCSQHLTASATQREIRNRQRLQGGLDPTSWALRGAATSDSNTSAISCWVDYRFAEGEKELPRFFWLLSYTLEAIIVPAACVFLCSVFIVTLIAL